MTKAEIKINRQISYMEYMLRTKKIKYSYTKAKPYYFLKQIEKGEEKLRKMKSELI